MIGAKEEGLTPGGLGMPHTKSIAIIKRCEILSPSFKYFAYPNHDFEQLQYVSHRYRPSQRACPPLLCHSSTSWNHLIQRTNV